MKAPKLLKQNFEAYELWGEIKTQWRGGGFGLVGLDYAEIRARAKELDIDLSNCMWKKIKVLEKLELERKVE